MLALPDCLEPTYPGPFLPARRPTSRLCLSAPVPCRSGRLSLLFHSVLAAPLCLSALVLSLPALSSCLPQLLPSAHPRLLPFSGPQRERWRVWPWAFQLPGRRLLPSAARPTSFGSWFLLPA